MAVLDTFRLDGRKALVTGGNRGLGLAFARGLAEAGAEVVISARDEARNAEAAATLRAEGHRVEVVTGDLVTDAERIVAESIAALDGLDILINNAGIAIHRPTFEVPDEEFDLVLGLNLKALWKTSIAAARHLKDHGGGSIVNIGSISSIIVNRPQWQASYNASKAAVHQLTKSLAAEWAPYGIRVNAIAPRLCQDRYGPGRSPRIQGPMD